MSFLHKREHMNRGDCAVVDCSHQCNVMLMDDNNFSKYKRGGRFGYLGGFYSRLPAEISVPHTTNWNIVLDLGGGSATVRHSINIIRN